MNRTTLTVSLKVKHRVLFFRPQSFVVTVSALQLGSACAGGSASLGLCREGRGRRPCRQGVSASSSWSEASGDHVNASTCCTLSLARCACRSSGFQGSANPLHLKKAMQTMVNNFNCLRVQSYIFFLNYYVPFPFT